MRKLCTVLVAVLFVLPALVPAMAQDIQQDIALDLADANHKALVYANLTLSDAEAAAFWPIFDVYLADLRELRKRRISMIRQLAEAFNNMDDATALELIDIHYGIEAETLDLGIAYKETTTSILPPIQAMRALQIEVKVLATERYQTTMQVPFVPTE